MSTIELTQEALHLNRAIGACGGITAFARRISAPSHSAVNHWRHERVPADYCPRIEEATGGLVRCEDLRPDVRWDVLRTPHTPQTPKKEVASV